MLQRKPSSKSTAIVGTGLLSLGAIKAVFELVLDTFGRWETAKQIKEALPSLIAAPWSAIVAIIGGVFFLYWSNRKPLVIRGVLDANGNPIEKKTHPVLRLSLTAFAVGIVVVTVTIGSWWAFSKVMRSASSKANLENPSVKLQQDSSRETPRGKDPIVKAPPTQRSPYRPPVRAPQVQPNKPAALPISQLAPATPASAVIQQPATTPAKDDPYTLLPKAISDLSGIAGDWGRALSDDEMYQFRENEEIRGRQIDDEAKRRELLQGIRDEHVARMQGLMDQMGPSWNPMRQSITHAVDLAIARMREPGSLQISLNEEKKQRDSFKVALNEADTAGPIFDKPIVKRFVALNDYLNKLEQKLRDYPENAKPQ